MGTLQQCTTLLRKTWIDYLNANAAELCEEKSLKLDSFLNKFFFLHEKYNFEKCPEFSDLTSCGNLLTRQFLTDVHQVCTKCANDDVTPLIHYLLEGRGWKILWLIKFVGVQTLSCNRDLAKLLLSLFPLCSKFYLYPLNRINDFSASSNMPSLDNIESCFQPFLHNRAQLISFQRNRQRHRNHSGSSQRSSRSTQRRFRHPKLSPASFLVTQVASTDSEDPQSTNDTSIKQKLVQFRLNPVDFMYFSKPGVKSSDEEVDICDNLLDEFVDGDATPDELTQKSSSFVAFCESVITLLQKICLEDNPLSSSSFLNAPVSADILPFAMNMLISVHEEHSFLESWSLAETYRTKQHLLHLIFTSASNLVCRPDGTLIFQHCSVIEKLLAVATLTSEQCSCLEENASLKEEAIKLEFNIICGCLMLLCIVTDQSLAMQDYSGLLKATALSPKQQEIIAKGISSYESHVIQDGNSKVCIRISNLIHMVTQTITVVKKKGIAHWHAQDCVRLRHKRCDLTKYNHHHNNIFGLDDSCCVSNFINTLLEIYRQTNEGSTQMLILASLKKVGLCCCVKVEIILGKVLECLEKQSLVLQQAAFNFIETTTLEQLAGSNNSSTTTNQYCESCRVKHEATATIVSSVLQAASRSSDFLKLLMLNEDLDATVIGWGAVKLYRHKLLSQNSSFLVHLLEKHILHLCLNGNHVVRHELFLRVIAPIAAKTAACCFQLENEIVPLPDHLIVCCLAAFSILLKERPLTELFVNTGGLELLQDQLKISVFRPLVLRVLCVLILTEVSKMNARTCSLSEIRSVCVFEEILTTHCTSQMVFENNGREITVNSTCSSKDVEQVEYECDLWNTCLVLIKKCKLYQKHFQLGNAAQLAYTSLMNLLKGMSDESSGTDELRVRRFLKGALNLLEVLLCVCLHVTPFSVLLDDGKQMIVDRHELIEDVKKNVLLLPISPTDNVRLSLETLLNVAQDQSTQRKRKSEQVYLEAFLPECDDTGVLELDDTMESAKHDEEMICRQDDGYEADAELPDVLQDPTDGDAQINCNGNRLVYVELVKVVFDVLIKFANQITNSEGNYDANDIRVLTSIVNRLVALARESIHSCMSFYHQNVLTVILQDFKKFFTHRSLILRELQINLLDLFVTVAQHWITCKAFSLFLDLFKIKEPPFDLLLAALTHLLAKTPSQPEYFLSFPSDVEGDSYFQKTEPIEIIEPILKETTSATRNLMEQLVSIQQDHLQEHELTPWSSAACVLPIQSADKISFSGKYSLSLWLRTFAPSRQFFSKERFRRHGGSDDWKKSGMMGESSFEISGFTSSECEENIEAFTSNVLCDRAVHVVSVGNNSVLFEVWSLPAFESVVVRISTNHSSNYTVVSEVVCKSMLQLGNWHHMAVTYFTEKQHENTVAKVKITIDGHITNNVLLDLTMSDADQTSLVKFLLVGNSQSNSANRRLAWYLGSLVFFKDALIGPHVNLAICALGPDSTNLLASLTEPDLIHFPTQPMVNLLKVGVNPAVLQESFKVRLSTLQDSLVLLYVPHKPYSFNLYSRETAQKEATDKEPMVNSFFQQPFSSSPEEFARNIQQTSRLLQVQVLHPMKVFTIHGIDSAISQLGGVPSMLLLLSRVIEKCSDDTIQAEAVGLTLRYCGRSVQHRREFLNIGGPALLTKLFSTQQFCAKYMTLKVILDSCVSSSLDICQLVKSTPVVQHTNSVIIDPDVLLCALSLWKIWEKDDLNIQIAFLQAVKELIREEHPHHVFNRNQLSPSLVNILLTSFKERLHDDVATISKEICHLIITLMGMMLKYEPDGHLLVGICKILLLALPVNSLFIRDDGNNFYFSLQPSPRLGPFTIAVTSSMSNSLKASRGTKSPFWAEDLFQLDADKLTNALTDVKLKEKDNSSPMQTWDGICGPSSSSKMNDQVVCSIEQANVSENDWSTAQTSGNTEHPCEPLSRAHSKHSCEQMQCVLQEPSTSAQTSVEKLEDFRNVAVQQALPGPSTFYEDFEIIPDSTRHSSPEIISGPEDSSPSEEWEVFSVIESGENCNNADDSDVCLVMLCAGFLSLLLDTIENLPREKRRYISASVIKPELLLVFAYNASGSIRTNVVKLLQLYLRHATEEQKNSFLKMKGFTILANQIHRYPATVDLANACLSLLLDRKFTFENQGHFSSIKISSRVQQDAVALTLAILPTSTYDTALCHNLLNVLLQMSLEISEFQQVLLDNSVIECMIHVILNILNAGPRLTDLVGIEEQDLLFNDVQKILDQISVSAASQESAVQFQTIRDIMMMLSYMEKQEVKIHGPASQSAQKMRYFQCSCLHSAIDHLYQHSLNSVTKATVYKKPDISQTQINQRLRQLLSKAVDFLLYLANLDGEIVVCDYEKSFIRYLIQTMIEAVNIVMTNTSERPGKTINSIIWSIRDIVKLQLLRLLVFLLNPNQPVDQRMFVVTVLMKEERPRALLNIIRSASIQLEQKFCYHLHRLLTSHDEQINTQDREACQQLMENVESCNIYTPSRIKPEMKRAWSDTETKKKRIWLKQNEADEKKIFDKYEVLNHAVFENVKNITTATFEAQIAARTEFLNAIKASHSYKIHVRSLWQQLISQLTHERAVWHFPECHPQSWQLNPQEGPSRERRRLQRCHLKLSKDFFIPEFRDKQDATFHQQPFSFLMEINSNFCCPAIVDCLNVTEKIKYTSNCVVVTPSCEAAGEVLVGLTSLYFIGEITNANSMNEKLNEAVTIKWNFDEIREILKRRYELQDNAAEIFLTNGQTHLLAFSKKEERNCLFKYLQEANLPNLVLNQDLGTVTQLWQDGNVTNFDYLMQLNKFSGRSFNDLMQYPVFPFVLSNYASPTLNLNENGNFRNLARPMAIQDKKREQRYIDNYEYCKVELHKANQSNTSDLIPFTEPYHYGSHYSNSIAVLYFLVRLPPYTGIFLKFQDSSFDIPDRSFHSLETSWRLSSSESNTDMKELIPEMFYLPELLQNLEGFELGTRQTGDKVRDVILPSWCQNNPRLFVLIHRQALESDFVTHHLHQWIDLIFGYKQTGKAAVEAVNVFHPSTYYGFKTESVNDPIRQAALRDMTRMLGQTPQQLFHYPHPMVALNLAYDEKPTKFLPPIIPEIQGLKWGKYVGSPAADEPTVVWQQKQSPPITSFMTLVTNDVFGLAENCCLILNYAKEKVKSTQATYVAGSALVTWGHVDSHVRIKLRRDGQPSILLKGSQTDPISCCVSVSERSYLFVGCKSGIITAYSVEYVASKRQINMLKQPVHLYGHMGCIIGLHTCSAFGILVSASEDGICIIWDLTSLSYVRTLKPLTSVKLVAVSSTSGDIALVSDAGIGSYLWLYTINGNLVCQTELSTIHALCFSCAPEGISVNVIATGMTDGKIYLWSTWDLRRVSVIEFDLFTQPIVCLTYSADAQQLYATNSDGVLVIWESGNKITKNLGKKPPKYNSLFW